MRTGSLALGLLLALPAAAEEALPVQIVTATPGVSGFDFVLTGTVEATNLYPVSFRTGGRVIEVLVEQGDLVQAGQLIARIDPTQQREVLRAAQAGLQAAEAGLLRAQQDYDRQAALVDRGTVTRAEFDIAREGLVTATSTRDQAQAQLTRAGRALDDTELRAPSAGIVTARMAEVGQVVGAAQTVINLADQAGRDAVFLAPDGAPIEDFLGAEVQLALIDHGRRPLVAHLSEVSPVVDPATGSVRVKARIDDPPADLPLLGETVEGSLVIPTAVAAVLPWQALTVAEGQLAVWTVDPATMRANLAPVTVDRFTTEGLLVSAGLAEGAQVVGQGSHMLFPGRLVQPSAEVAP